ncbi:NAD(P)H-dependent oxidoreductase [Sphingomonas sp. BIUV-7]|uniref:FMN dependent NADH:quinone oxidoreductase n=1 Tax=Sphingomonas natans TaxID=3063330 RepID=A0ABT8Y681_9SPHN|nr:NAD(P)H-dependent oxidoreductase [Sphingomonas sp. BIUV-7]MDO6413811.1 NAD(P)H-dependent oxidoreductase [Sphingomonas sp. BIUV-7]
MKLLQIDSSILGENSVSRQLTAAIVDQLRASDPSIAIVSRDLAADPVPHLTLATLPAANPDARADLDQFKAADIVVIGAPMYNFTVPSQLKAWIDRILVAGETFAYGDNGPKGLAGGKRVIVAVSSGNVYGAGTAYASYDHLATYLRAVFGFIGIEPEFVTAEGIAFGPEQRAASIEQALGTVSALAA